MQALQAYGDDNSSSSESDSEVINNSKNNNNKPTVPSRSINSAPAVVTNQEHRLSLTSALSRPIDANAQVVAYNATASAMWAPAQGPAHPHRSVPSTVDAVAIEAHTFDDEFHSNRYTEHHAYNAPSVGRSNNIDSSATQGSQRKRAKLEAAAEAKKEEEVMRAAVSASADDGPWGPQIEDEEWNMDVAPKASPARAAMADADDEDGEGVQEPSELSEEQQKYNADLKARREEQRKVREEEEKSEVEIGNVSNATSTFEGKSEVDYQGRSWVVPPSTVRPDSEHDCFVPKKLVHQWTGHKRGVQAIEFFPKYGHLLLSGSMDSTVKIWDVHNDRRCMRTYTGHTAAVRAISFNNDGKQFLSSSFDKKVRLWDTETGQCKASFSNGYVPLCSKFYPIDNNLFLSGCQNRRIVQWDARTGEIAQEYDYHLNQVTTVTFFDEGRRFVSTSDDKKMLVWEWGFNAPIKYISDPNMHAIPAVTMHPSGRFLAAQSMDNQIKVFEAGEKVRQVKRRSFKGHHVAGFACQIAFSPNGRYVMSGDGRGKAFFWDWKSGKQIRKLDAHSNGPCIGTAWHPVDPSRVATCGWDGIIKYWE